MGVFWPERRCAKAMRIQDFPLFVLASHDAKVPETQRSVPEAQNEPAIATLSGLRPGRVATQVQKLAHAARRLRLRQGQRATFNSLGSCPSSKCTECVPGSSSHRTTI